MKIAVSGKGGVGKTLISGGLAYSFAKKGLKTIAIDADPSPNLALTLGLSLDDARKIMPVSENKALIDSKTSTGYSGVYRLSFTVDDIIKDFSVNTIFGVNLIVMGTVKSVGSGCTCPANSVVRALLRHLVEKQNEVIIVDMEAGVEHLGRATSGSVDALIVVVNPGKRSRVAADKIRKLGTDIGIKNIVVLGNRVRSDEDKKLIKESTSQVSGGTRLSRDSGDSLHGIVESVNGVSKELEDMAYLAQEQAASMEEGSSITETNAKSAEVLAEAAATMAEEVENLTELISRFKVK